MMLSRLFFAVFLLACPVLLKAQSIDRYVISSAGSFGSNGAALWSNIGESMVNTFVSSQVMLSEGYLQPDTALITIVPALLSANDIIAYPVPASQSVNVEVKNTGGELTLRLYDIAGKIQDVKYTLSLSGDKASYSIDIDQLSPGIYLFDVVDASNGTRTILRISKL